LIQAIDDKLITENRVYITPELVSLFKTNWSQLVTTLHECKFALPFYHLTSDGFWILKPKMGYEKILNLKYSMRSFNQLNTAVEYAEFSDDLFDILKSNLNRSLLKKTLLDSYFPLSKNNYKNPGNNNTKSHSNN
jgi:putative restriction endonuclease